MFFQIFPNLEILILFAKNLKFRWKRHFQELMSFDTHSATKLSFLPILKKKSILKVFFSKELNIRTYWRNLIILIQIRPEIFNLQLNVKNARN